MNVSLQVYEKAFAAIKVSHPAAYQVMLQLAFTEAMNAITHVSTAPVVAAQVKARNTGKGTPTHASINGTYKRFDIAGKSACAVLRQLGYQGLSVKTAHAAMLANGYDVSATTAAIQVGNGRKLKANGATLPAMLTDAQYDAFMAQYHEASNT